MRGGYWSQIGYWCLIDFYNELAERLGAAGFRRIIKRWVHSHED